MTDIVNVIIKFLNKTGIQINNINELNGYIIDREILLDESKIQNMKEEINIIKKYFAVSIITSLQKNAKSKQKWPLLNMVRQILKTMKFKMIPFKKSNGYDINKKKIFKRFFIVEKMNN